MELRKVVHHSNFPLSIISICYKSDQPTWQCSSRIETRLSIYTNALPRHPRFTATVRFFRKERGLFSTLSEHNSLRPGRINGGGSAFNPATKPRHRLVLSWSRPRTGFDISITRFGIEATSNSMPPSSSSLHPGRFDVLSSSVVEERRGWETRWCRRRGPINQSGRETRGVEGWFGGVGGLRGRRAGEKRESGRRAGESQGL